MYNRLINQPGLKGAYNITFSLIDKGALEIIGPTGGGNLAYRLGTLLSRFQTGRVYDYAAFLLTGVLFAVIGVDSNLLYIFLQQSTAYAPFLLPLTVLPSKSALLLPKDYGRTFSSLASIGACLTSTITVVPTASTEQAASLQTIDAPSLHGSLGYRWSAVFSGVQDFLFLILNTFGYPA